MAEKIVQTAGRNAWAVFNLAKELWEVQE